MLVHVLVDALLVGGGQGQLLLVKEGEGGEVAPRVVEGGLLEVFVVGGVVLVHHHLPEGGLVHRVARVGQRPPHAGEQEAVLVGGDGVALQGQEGVTLVGAGGEDEQSAQKQGDGQ